MKIFSAQLKGTTIVASGSSATITGSFTGSIAGIDINATNTFTSSTIARLNSIETITSSNVARLNAIETITSSNIARLNSIEIVSASNISRIGSLETISASNISRIGSIETITASNVSRLNSLEIKTGSLATTGSNFFSGSQTITGSLYISADLIVQGSSSLQNITASAVSIGTNLINLNTANPAIRYAGLSIGDSGSVGGSGSFLYDSVQDEMIFIHRGANTTVTSSVVLMGPQTFDNIGSETYPTNNIIQKGTGNEHLVDSCIFDNGTTTCVKNNLIGTGTACFGSVTSGGNICTSYVSLSNSYPNITFLQNSIGNIVTTGANDIAFRPNDTEKMRITSIGNVGVGTGTPLSIFHVNCCVAGGATTTVARFGIQDSTGYGTTSPAIELTGTNIGLCFTMGKIAGINDVSSGGSMAFSTGLCAGTVIERMRITSGGSVGIGTTNTTGKVNIQQTINDSGLYFFNCAAGTRFMFNHYCGSGINSLIIQEFDASNTFCRNIMTFASGGNVGIGTATPTSLLHLVQSTSNLNIYLQNTLGSGKTWAVNSDTNGNFNIHDTAVNRLTITSAGITCFAGTVCAPIITSNASTQNITGIALLTTLETANALYIITVQPEAGSGTAAAALITSRTNQSPSIQPIVASSSLSFIASGQNICLCSNLGYALTTRWGIIRLA